ncbi:hypothetical protein EDB86DRAFT_3088075 [Lactarius hatsudake]|nr:hypothetical protein EDB86DRAFT_3088075 [Lactarius hatsudake]
MPGISVGGWRFGGLSPNILQGLDEPFHGAGQRDVYNVDAREDCSWTQFPFVRGCERERRVTKGETNTKAVRAIIRAPHRPYTDTTVKILQNTTTGRHNYGRKRVRA